MPELVLAKSTTVDIFYFPDSVEEYKELEAMANPWLNERSLVLVARLHVRTIQIGTSTYLPTHIHVYAI